MSGWIEARPIHVVAESDSEIIVITVYEPDPGKSESDFATRKRQ